MSRPRRLIEKFHAVEQGSEFIFFKQGRGEVMAKAKDKQEMTRQDNDQGMTDERRSERQRSGEGDNAGRGNLARRESFMPTRWSSPFTLMRLLGEDMARLFGDADLARGMAAENAAWAPQIEVMERDGQLVVRADLPGLSKDDVQVELRDDSLIIKGERQQQHEDRREGYYRSERVYGSFYRQIPLPKGVDTQNATATFRDGVLEITMQAPKREPQSRQLQIQDAQAGQQQSQSQAKAAGTSG
jgi:HSP20 family protein